MNTITGLCLGSAWFASLISGGTTHDAAWLFRTIVAVSSIIVLSAHLRQDIGIHARTWTLGFLTLWPFAYFVFASDARDIAWQRFLSMGTVLLLFVFLQNRERRRSAQASLALLIIVQILWALFQSIESTRAAGGFVNPNYFGTFIVCATLILAQAITQKWQWPLTLVGLCLAVGLSGSRQALLAALLAMTFLIWQHFKHKRFIAIGTLLSIFTAGLYFGRHRLAAAGDAFAYNRFNIWSTTTSIIADHPLGVGIGVLRDHLLKRGIYIDGPVHYPKVATNAHQQWLQILGEMGYLALALYIGLFLWLGYSLYRRREAFLTAAWISVAVSSLFSNVLQNLAILGLLAFLIPEDTSARPAHTVRWTTLLALATSIIVLGSIRSGAQRDFEYAKRVAKEGDLGTARRAIERAERFAPYAESIAAAGYEIRKASGEDSALLLGELLELKERFPKSDTAHQKLLRRQDLSFPMRVRTYQSAIERRPTEVRYRFGLAKQWLKMGDVPAAKKELEAALRYEENYARALWLLAELHTESAQKEFYRKRAKRAHATPYSEHKARVRILQLPQSLLKSGINP